MSVNCRKTVVEIIGDFDDTTLQATIEYPVDFEEGFLKLTVHYDNADHVVEDSKDPNTKEIVLTTAQAEEIAKSILHLIKKE